MAEWFATMCSGGNLCGVDAAPPAPSEQPDEEGCYTILEYGSDEPPVAATQPPPGVPPGPHHGGADARGGSECKEEAAHHDVFAAEKGGPEPLNKPSSAGSSGARCATDALVETDPDAELEAFVVRARRCRPSELPSSRHRVPRACSPPDETAVTEPPRRPAAARAVTKAMAVISHRDRRRSPVAVPSRAHWSSAPRRFPFRLPRVRPTEPPRPPPERRGAAVGAAERGHPDRQVRAQRRAHRPAAAARRRGGDADVAARGQLRDEQPARDRAPCDAQRGARGDHRGPAVCV